MAFDGGPQVRGTQEGLRGSMIGEPEGKKRKDRLAHTMNASKGRHDTS